MTKRFKMICAKCGSDDVRADAYASWNVEAQAWELSSTHDKGSVCNACDGECSIDEEEIEEGTIADAEHVIGMADSFLSDWESDDGVDADGKKMRVVSRGDWERGAALIRAAVAAYKPAQEG